MNRIDREWLATANPKVRAFVNRRTPAPYEVRSGLTADDVEHLTGYRPVGEPGETYVVEFY